MKTITDRYLQPSLIKTLEHLDIDQEYYCRFWDWLQKHGLTLRYVPRRGKYKSEEFIIAGFVGYTEPQFGQWKLGPGAFEELIDHKSKILERFKKNRFTAK